MTDGPYRDNNLDLLRAENTQLKKEVALIRLSKDVALARRDSNLVVLVRENRSLIFALAVCGLAVGTGEFWLLWLLMLLSFEKPPP